VSRQSRFTFIFFVQQEPEPGPEPEPEPEPRARIWFRFFLGQNYTVPAVPVPAPVPQHWIELYHCTSYQLQKTILYSTLIFKAEFSPRKELKESRTSILIPHNRYKMSHTIFFTHSVELDKRHKIQIFRTEKKTKNNRDINSDTHLRLEKPIKRMEEKWGK
jgi:hypothetical protein